MKTAANALPFAVIAAVVFFAYRKVTRLWWMFDDPFQLRMLRDVPLPSLLNSRTFYGGSSVFTPLLVASLKIDEALFGTNAVPFYVHQLVAIALAIVAEYVLLRMWCSPAASTAAVLATLFGTPLVYTAPLLMCRHYIEGALFVFVSAIAFVFALRRSRMSFAIVSAVAFFLAACAKEIYLPLPILLLALPEGDRRRRIRYVVPHAVALLAYTIWRLLAIGFDIEPYGFVTPPGGRALQVASIPWRMLHDVAMTAGWAGVAAVSAVAFALAVIFVCLRQSRVLIIVALVMAVLPVVPLASALERRYAFTLWLVVCACVAFLPRALPRVGTWLAVGVAIVAFLSFRVQWPQNYRDLMRMSDEARVLSLLGPDDIVYKPLTSPTTMLELKQLTGTPAIAVYDELPYCEHTRRLGRIFEYDTPLREMREVPRAPIDRACASIVTRPMRVEIRFDATHAWWWHLGPYTSGRWTFIFADAVVAYDVPDHGGFRRAGWDNFTLRVRYISPAGWRTYSPLIRVDGTKPVVGFTR